MTHEQKMRYLLNRLAYRLASEEMPFDDVTALFVRAALDDPDVRIQSEMPDRQIELAAEKLVSATLFAMGERS